MHCGLAGIAGRLWGRSRELNNAGEWMEKAGKCTEETKEQNEDGKAALTQSNSHEILGTLAGKGGEWGWRPSTSMQSF